MRTASGTIHRRTLTLVVLLTTGGLLEADIRVSPATIVLDSPEASQQILVTADVHDDPDAPGRTDLTRDAGYEITGPGIITIDDRGLVQPVTEGETVLVVRHDDDEVRVPVEVRGLARPSLLSFEQHIIPILTKAKCNSGACHGKAEGKNGFKLSVFGFDPRADHEALVAQSRGRRVFPAVPEYSLVLRKATAEAPHGGGLKIERGSLPYRRLRRWISEGGGFAGEASPSVAIEIEPEHRILAPGECQQVRVTVIESTGVGRDVTTEAEYDTDAELIAEVDSRGLIRAGTIPGEATILVRYMGHVAVCRVTRPRQGVEWKRPPEANFIDRLVWDKLERLGIAPSELAGDATFLRRVFLDTIGALPSPAEARAFLESSAPDRRKRLVDALLEREEYADYSTMRWSDLLRIDKDRLTPQGAVAVTRWLRRQFAMNRPYDEMVREILTAQGDTLEEGPAALYRAFDSPEVLGRSMSQLFLGVRIECAQCHHHPFERWGQEDYFGLAGFFTGIQKKNLPTGSTAIFAAGGADLLHPRTGKPVPARALAAAPADFTGVRDRRRVLAEWMTSTENPFFARAIVNRLWSHYFGRGLVEPIDDLRVTNPGSNEKLLAELAQRFRQSGHDMAAFTRTLLGSRVYQLSWRPTISNAEDDRSFSHAAWKTLPAEVLLDGICQATGVPEKFTGWPPGYRAVQIWDNRMPSYFFRIFGRPVRASVCECERSKDPSIAQALHLMNSPEIIAKVQAPEGRARRLAESERSPPEVVRELFLATLSRFPTDEEAAVLAAVFEDVDRRQATEDVLWALLNSKEFIYNH